MTDDPTPAIGIYLPARGRMRSKCEIRHADAGPCDCYAHPPSRCECKSRAGRQRRHHSYLHESWQGMRCVFCDRIRPFDPI